MNGVRAELDEWTRENAKRGKVLCKAYYEGWKGRIAEWMVLFMRTDFRSDIAATLIGRERKEGCWGWLDEADERAVVESTVEINRVSFSFPNYSLSRNDSNEFLSFFNSTRK